MTPLARLDTERLVLRASDPAHAAEVAAFYTRNRVAHAPWSPPPSPTLFTATGQQQRLLGAAMAEADGSQVGWWLSLREAPDRIVGQLRFSQVSRGPFYSAMLGYSLDSACEGRGLMHEALVAALADAFGPRVALHRVQANARPENARSLRLLDRLGFEREGYARQYLFIDGAWRDHVLTALRAPDWPVDRAP